MRLIRCTTRPPMCARYAQGQGTGQPPLRYLTRKFSVYRRPGPCRVAAMAGLRETVLKEITEKSPADFVAEHLFDRVPHVFANRQEFIMWKRRLAVRLEVDPADLTLVGSGATG